MAYARIEAFKQAYPSGQFQLVPNFDEQQLLTGFASDQLPDLIWMGRDKVATWAIRGVLSPLTDFISGAGFDPSQCSPSAWEQTHEAETQR